MTEPAMRSLLLAIRRATAHLRIYGPTHEVTEAAFRDIADAADSLIGSAARMMITVLDRTLASYPDIHLIGCSYKGIGIGDCVHQAQVASERILQG